MRGDNKKDKLKEEEAFLEAKTTLMESSDHYSSELYPPEWNLDEPLSPEEFEPVTQYDEEEYRITEPISEEASQQGAIVPSTGGSFIPVAPKRISSPSHELIMLLYPDSIAADQFRYIKFQLNKCEDIQVIGVTSPQRGEGKSVVAANIALALSESGRERVLLIDCCVRSPRLSSMFGIEETFGLITELKNKHLDPNYVPRIIGIAEAFYFLPAGPSVSNPTAILGSDVMLQFIYELRSAFRYIVLDISPVLVNSDANALFDCVDTYILTAMIKKTKQDELEQALARLTTKKFFGVVVVGAYPEQ